MLMTMLLLIREALIWIMGFDVYRVLSQQMWCKDRHDSRPVSLFVSPTSCLNGSKLGEEMTFPLKSLSFFAFQIYQQI